MVNIGIFFVESWKLKVESGALATSRAADYYRGSGIESSGSLGIIFFDESLLLHAVFSSYKLRKWGIEELMKWGVRRINWELTLRQAQWPDFSLRSKWQRLSFQQSDVRSDSLSRLSSGRNLYYFWWTDELMNWWDIIKNFRWAPLGAPC